MSVQDRNNGEGSRNHELGISMSAQGLSGYKGGSSAAVFVPAPPPGPPPNSPVVLPGRQKKKLLSKWLGKLLQKAGRVSKAGFRKLKQVSRKNDSNATFVGPWDKTPPKMKYVKLQPTIVHPRDQHFNDDQLDLLLPWELHGNTRQADQWLAEQRAEEQARQAEMAELDDMLQRMNPRGLAGL